MRNRNEFAQSGKVPTAQEIAKNLRARRAETALKVVGGPAPTIDPVAHPPNAQLMLAWGARRCIRDGLVPWRRVGRHVVILTADRDTFERHKAGLQLQFGPVKSAIAELPRLQQAVQRLADPLLAGQAETRSAEIDSCRDWDAASSRRISVALLIGAVIWALLAPISFMIWLGALACLASISGSVLKCAALLAHMRAPPRAPDAPLHAVRQLPIISIMVPLFREEHIADHLRKRLMRLNYPRDRLDVIIVVEMDDHVTLATLARTPLPPWFRALTVPRGGCQTKPRALNYGLDFARGDIVGVYDAEDAPDPDQLLAVARRFAQAAPDVACLQGMLDFYNSESNWMARCFSVEYAGWFRIILPGLERLGMVIPLGGTTLFFRRDILENLGGWDAHNVTEDADLGIRLARRGYRTEILPTVTYEEANARAWPWVKQRSRWIKGYAITYWVHMRRPLQLLRDLGLKRFLGLQIQFGAALLNSALAPILWTFWLGLFGFHHPFLAALGGVWIWGLLLIFLATELLNITVGAAGCSLAGHRRLLKWVPSLHLYHPLATIASYKAFWELLTKPFYWDKTAHGIFKPQSGKD